MLLRKWDDLPEFMQTDAVRPYYQILEKKKASLVLKRAFDIFASSVLLLVLSPTFLILTIAIAIDSKGPVFYRQKRITSYGKAFRIHKFRTMVVNADKIGAHVTSDHDPRVTRVGRLIRSCRLDELPQLIDVLTGNMTFVGTRPEAERYVSAYTDEMNATLLLPAGITSQTSILFSNEQEFLKDASNADETYVNVVLPQKMKINLWELKHFSFFGDIKTMFRTAFAVLGIIKPEMPDDLKEE